MTFKNIRRDDRATSPQTELAGAILSSYLDHHDEVPKDARIVVVVSTGGNDGRMGCAFEGYEDNDGGDDRLALDLQLMSQAIDLGAPPPVCSTCNDTHSMELRGQLVMCTRCPVPCEACRQQRGGNSGPGAFCETTPCACDCHKTKGGAAMILSKHQSATLVALLDGPRRVTDVAAAIGMSWSATAAVVKTLCERGLISVLGVAGARRQTPKTYTYQLTAAGRATAPRETGTLYVNGSKLGPAERDPRTGNIEAGPHVTTRAARNGDIAVLRVDQSPMNAKRWVLTLSCGHEVWITAARQPKRKTSKCSTCAVKYPDYAP